MSCQYAEFEVPFREPSRHRRGIRCDSGVLRCIVQTQQEDAWEGARHDQRLPRAPFRSDYEVFRVVMHQRRRKPTRVSQYRRDSNLNIVGHPDERCASGDCMLQRRADRLRDHFQPVAHCDAGDLDATLLIFVNTSSENLAPSPPSPAQLPEDVLLPGRGCAHHHVERVVAATRHGPSPRSLESTPPDSRDADKTIPSIPSSR